MLNTVDGCIPSDLGVGTQRGDRRRTPAPLRRHDAGERSAPSRGTATLLRPRTAGKRGQARLRAKDPFHSGFDHATLRKLHVADRNAGNPVIRSRPRQNGRGREVAAHVGLTATRACPFSVIRDLADQGRRSYLSAVTPTADKRRRGWIVRFVPKADITKSA